VRDLPPHFSGHHFEIYSKHARHVSLANQPCTPETYQAAFVDTGVETHFFEYWIGGRLAAVSILDEGELTVSSAYTCWDPIFARSSPGTFSALWEMAWARERGKLYYHLGYWVRDCTQMSYKNRFRPCELMSWDTGEWREGP
jgi:arginine-tRNA-protein transferase